MTKKVVKNSIQRLIKKLSNARRLSATIITAGLGVSRRADAWDEEHQAYPKDTLIIRLSVKQAYRIGPERGAQTG